jgi:3-oxoadipate enol-lactonase
MDRRLANGTVNAAEIGKGPPLVLFHSLLSDRASFDGIVPALSQAFRVVVPELPGFGDSSAVEGGFAAITDRIADAVKDCASGEDVIVVGNGYGGFVALQMAIRHPALANRLILADCGATFSEAGREAFRNMAAQPHPNASRRSPMSRCVDCSRLNLRRRIRI